MTGPAFPIGATGYAWIPTQQEQRKDREEEIALYRALCDAAFSVLTLKARREIQVIDDMPDALPVKPYDYSEDLKRLIDAREDAQSRLEALSNLDEKMREIADAVYAPMIKSEIRNIEERMDYMNKMIEEQNKEKEA